MEMICTKIAYTDNGNKYKKTTLGTKIGMASGAYVAFDSIKKYSMSQISSKDLNKIKKFKNKIRKKFEEHIKVKNFILKLKTLEKKSHVPKKTADFLEKFLKNKKAQPIIIGITIINSCIPFVISGKRIGTTIDNQINKFSQSKADKSKT